MTTPENPHPKRKLSRLQFTILVILALMLIGSLSSGNEKSSSGTSTSSSVSSQNSDVGTRMACKHWRINLSNASVETIDQKIEGAQKVWKYASVSTIPEIVSSARGMTEAMINQDAEAYLSYGTAFGNACNAAGQ